MPFIKIADEWHELDETPGITFPVPESPFGRDGCDHQKKPSKCGLWGLSRVAAAPLPGEPVCGKCRPVEDASPSVGDASGDAEDAAPSKKKSARRG